VRRLFIGACAGFLAGYTLVRAADALSDLRSPRKPLPHDPARYGATRRALMLAGIARGLAANAVMAFAVADRLPERLRRNETLAGAALYYAGGTLLEAMLETPIDYVERFVIERRYELSDQSLRGWLEERAKATAVSIALATPIVTGLMAAVRRFPRRWPLVATAAVPPLLILANLFIPVYVSPLFNRFEPLRGPLEERLRALASRYGVDDAEILRFDLSRQTKKANAYVAGLFRTHRIVVADTLLEGFDAEEIEFVVAHELGHYVARDTWIGVVVGSIASAALILGAHELARRDEDPVTTAPGLQRFTFYLTLLGTMLGPLLATGSRAIERRADRFAVHATDRPESGIAAFERLRERNLAEDEQPRWAEILFSTHPSLKSRIAALRSV
jgi:STE24 endopeptidase